MSFDYGNINYLNPPLVYYYDKDPEELTGFINKHGESIKNYINNSIKRLHQSEGGNVKAIDNILKTIAEQSYLKEQTLFKEIYYDKEADSIKGENYDKMVNELFNNGNNVDTGVLAFIQEVTDPSFASNIVEMYQASSTDQTSYRVRAAIRRAANIYYQTGEDALRHKKDILNGTREKGDAPRMRKISGELLSIAQQELESEFHEEIEKGTLLSDIGKEIPEIVFTNISLTGVKGRIRFNDDSLKRLRKLSISYKIDFSNFSELINTISKEIEESNEIEGEIAFNNSDAISSFLLLVKQSLIHSNAKDFLDNKQKELESKIKKACPSINDDIIKMINQISEIKNLQSIIKELSSPNTIDKDEIIKNIKDMIQEYDDQHEQSKILNSDDLIKEENIEANKIALQKRIDSIINGYLSSIKGKIGEIFYSALLQAINTGADKNKTTSGREYEKHFDIQIGDLGAQVKIYTPSSPDQYVLYEGEVGLDSPFLEKYVGKNVFNDAYSSGAIALQYLAMNKKFFDDRLKLTTINETFFIEVLKQRLTAFMRIEDFLDESGIRNNFFFVNNYIIPTSVVLNYYRKIIKSKDPFNVKTGISFPDPTSGDDEAIKDIQVSKNLVRLKNVRFKFSGIPLNMNEIIKR